jgi:dTDP-4-amino-4,6-dideoxygalactose transaminase
MVIKYPLASTSWDVLEYAALNRVIESGNFTMGKEVEKFENQFAKFFDSSYAVMVNSGSSANLLMLEALKFSKKLSDSKNEIIVPCVSWSTTYFPVNQAGFKLIFVDVSSDTFNIDVNLVAKAISSKTAAVLAVNLLGTPANLVELQKICEENDLFLLEDNCESMGAKIDHKYAGTYGLMGTFSSFFSHHISTMEGGMIVTNDSNLYDILISLRAHGWIRNLKDNNSLYKKSGNSWNDSFKFVLPGYNLRPLEFSGAIGQEQLKKLPSFVQNRRKNFQKFKLRAESFSKYISIQQDDYEGSSFGFGMILNDPARENKENFKEFIENKGIEFRPIVAGNFVRNPVMSYLDYDVVGQLTNGDLIHDFGFFIGNHHFDIETEINYFFDCFDEFLELL